MNRILLASALLLAGCASLIGRDPVSPDFDKAASAEDASIRETKARTSLGRLEAAIADYYKLEKRIPPKLDLLVPKYIAEIPSVDLPACGRESESVEYYAPDVMRGGQVDGSRIKGRGGWGYVYNDRQVIVFVDCLKRAADGTPWYKERGVY